ncbi:MAG: hypothetical protein EP146_19080 [Oscillibacter sp.]|nr:hypothetical protein [Oscillibacter sp.]
MRGITSPEIRIFNKWHGLYKNVNFIRFANITEYAHFVSNHFDVAQKKYRDSQSVIDRGNDVLNHAAVLRFLDETSLYG